MTISVIRHAKAVAEDGTQDDAQRPLTSGGAKAFNRLVKRFKKSGEMDPDVIFTGPETRNVQTAAIAADRFGLDATDIIQTANLGPGGDALKAFAEIRNWVAANGDPLSSDVLVVGSNPTISALAQLIEGLGTKPNQGGKIPMRKGSIASMTVYGIDGSRPTSELRAYMAPCLAGK